MSNSSEADTCRKYVLPKLYAAGWNDDQINEQKSFTDGRIIIAGNKASRKKQKRADYLLRYRRDFTIAVVEAKPEYKQPGDGLQQAKEYAQILGLKFAYATNGHGIVEHDYLTGNDNDMDAFPTPDELWGRLRQAEHISDDIADRLLEPYYHLSGKTPRAAHPCHRHWQNGRRVPNLLEIVELALEPDCGVSKAEDSLPCRSECLGGSTEGQDVHAVR